jgi:DNA-binding XRE family transcriptional regulator
MQEPTKKHHTEELVTVTVRVRASKVAYSIAEVFPEYTGREKEIALRAYRNREGLTQKRLAEITGIPQHQISEMENGKRSIGKERARKLADALHCDYRQLL